MAEEKNKNKQKGKKETKETKRQRTLLDWMTDIIVVGVIIVLLVVVGDIVHQKISSNKSANTNTTAAVTATPAPKTSLEKGDTLYSNAISNGSKNSATLFQLVLNDKKKTFREIVKASTQQQVLGSGSYTKKGDKIYLKSSLSPKADSVYIQDGKYLLASNQFYQGKLGTGKRFDALFTDKESTYTSKLQFKKDGTYTDTTTTKAATTKKSKKNKNKSITTTGTYKRNGKFIVRSASNGESLIDFYIYKNQITNAYYKFEKTQK